MRHSPAIVALAALIASVSFAVAQTSDEGDNQQAAESASWEDFEKDLPEPAKKAFQSCSVEDLDAALADLPDNDAAKDHLARARDAVVAIWAARAKSEELDNKGEIEGAVEGLEPAFEKLPDMIAYGGCKAHADEVLKAMAELSAPFQLQSRLKQAVKACDLGRMRVLAGQIADNDRADKMIKDDAGLKDALSVIAAVDAADGALKAGDAGKAETALAPAESAAERAPINNCKEIKAKIAETLSEIATLRDYGDKLSRAAADCDKPALKEITNKLSKTSGLWAGTLSDDLLAAYRTCSAKTASWRKVLEEDF